jgi:hypothetical protein
MIFEGAVLLFGELFLFAFIISHIIFFLEKWANKLNQERKQL